MINYSEISKINSRYCRCHDRRTGFLDQRRDHVIDHADLSHDGSRREMSLGPCHLGPMITLAASLSSINYSEQPCNLHRRRRNKVYAKKRPNQVRPNSLSPYKATEWSPLWYSSPVHMSVYHLQTVRKDREWTCQ